MKKIQLTQGKFTLVDDEDFEFLSRFKWHYNKNTGYASCKMYVHKLLMQPKKGQITDHVNMDRLDNRRSNLRNCTYQQNRSNRNKQINNTSGYKGVSWDKKMKKWQAGIKFNYKNIHLGYWDNIIDAAKAYNQAAVKYFGQFAKLNPL